MTKTVKEQLLKIVEMFQSNDIPKAIKEVTFPPFEVPSNKWSLANKLIMFFSGTADARGFNQWKTTERTVNRGAKAIYILAPNMIKKTVCPSCKASLSPKAEKCHSCGATISASSTKPVLAGFRAIPVFKVEDTTGEPLEYQRIEIPELPLLDVAKSWGINVRGVAFQGTYMGYYRHSDKVIGLATPEEKTFFHELAHASQDRLGMLKKEKDRIFSEVTAEISALVLSELVGKGNPNHGATYEYIKHHIKTDDKAEIGKYLLKVLSSIERIVNNITIASLTANIGTIPEQELAVC